MYVYRAFLRFCAHAVVERAMTAEVWDGGLWTPDDFSGICPSAPPPSPELPTRRLSSPLALLAESLRLNVDLFDRAKDPPSNSPGLPSISVDQPPSDSREAPDQRDGLYRSGSFSFSSNSSNERYEGYASNEEEMDIQESMEISESGSFTEGALVSPTFPTRISPGLAVATSSFPIPAAQAGFNMSHPSCHVAHSWHQGMGGLGGVSPPRHKPLSQSYSYNEYDKTRRRSFSRRRQAEKASALEAGDCGSGQDSMECEMSGKKSCQESVAVAYQEHPNAPAAFPLVSNCHMSSYLSSPHLGSQNLLQPPPPFTRTGRLSEPALTTETHDPTLSRSL